MLKEHKKPMRANNRNYTSSVSSNYRCIAYLSGNNNNNVI